MSAPLTAYPVLCVDDERDNLEVFDLNFGEEFAVLTADSSKAALELLAAREIAVLVVDQRMPGMTGLELLVKAREVRPEAVAILLTAYRDVEVLVAAINGGLVHRYVQKPWDRQELAVVLRQAVELYAVQQENRLLARRLEELNRYLGREVESRHNFGELVGRSGPLRAVVETIRKAAPTRSTILITGESGTGKELAARALHLASPRAERPFVRVNLAALPPTLIESELFGHEKGAFTGAVAQRLGRFELAHQGTLFLDEIGDLPPATQMTLLRVIQEREFERVGGSRTIPVDVRLIAATHQDLSALVAAGTFREDLYYRINVFPVHMPPLRERPEDILDLANHFLRRFEPGVGRRFSGFTPEAAAILGSYSWPGNVRELENAVERAMILADGESIGASALAFLAPQGAPAGNPTGSFDDYLEALERRRLVEAMEHHGGAVSAVARELGINRTTVYYRLKKHGLMK